MKFKTAIRVIDLLSFTKLKLEILVGKWSYHLTPLKDDFSVFQPLG